MNIVGITQGGGKGPPAYYVDKGFPACRGVIPGVFLRTWYDCKGRPYGPWRKWECVLEVNGKWKDKPIYGFGLLGSAGQSAEKAMNDVRTIEMMAAGCCPPQLMEEFIRDEVA